METYKTIAIQIGNSDNRLSQRRWSEFCWAVDEEIRRLSKEIHFTGFSPTDSPYQNACWIAEFPNDHEVYLKNKLRHIRFQYKQQSIAWLEGDVEFV